MIVLLTLSLILLCGLNTVSAATWNHFDPTNSSTTSTSSTINNNPSSNTELPRGPSTTGSVSSTLTSEPTVTFTTSQIIDASSRVKSFVETNKRLPNYVTINNIDIEMPEFLEILSDATLKINSGSNSTVTLTSVNIPTSPSESFKSGNIKKTEYINLANKINSFINTNGRLPNYITTSLGKMRYESLINMFSRILAFYDTNKRLPTYVSVQPGAVPATTSSTTYLASCLLPTKNCQSGNSSIVALASSITAGLSSTYDRAVALFDWVRDNITYTSSYYNTKYGALGTLNSRIGNCCDHSNLLNALARASGIPARYKHGNCLFSDGYFGHVWSQLYVNGKWYDADAMSTENTFGVINNWDTSHYTLKGIYVELPF